MNAIYPFSAIVGQARLKHALLLCAIDPSLGGVLVRGPRGVAKTTLARALGELLPGTFVELPLGASDDRVTGTLDLDAALSAGRVQFSPGLLARAHEGVLYVDEVNLLPDALVDLLLDAAASGQNTVERDGVSHVHPARFVLVGTMNPDEGELRPQLIDRFGLSARADAEIAPAERVEIVTRRLDFERDPAAFRARHAAQQAELLTRCEAARARAGAIPLSGPALALVAERCHAARVEGVRADLAMLRAARAHAAWNGRDEIVLADVDAVAELALEHRRRGPAPGGGSGGGSPPQGPDGTGGAGRREPASRSGNTARDTRAAASRASAAAGSGSSVAQRTAAPADPAREREPERGARAPVPVRPAGAVELPVWITSLPAERVEHRRRGTPRLRAARGVAQRGATRADAERAGIDWFATLLAGALVWAGAGRRASGGGRPGRAELRYRARRAPCAQLWIVAIDCSASMLRAGALGRAKAVASALQARAARVGARLTLISFRGSGARTERGSMDRFAPLEQAIASLGAGGGTPLRDAVREAYTHVERSGATAKRLVLLTDGRSREPVHDLARGRTALDVVVIDCERGPVRLGRADALAAALGGRCVHVDALT